MTDRLAEQEAAERAEDRAILRSLAPLPETVLALANAIDSVIARLDAIEAHVADRVARYEALTPAEAT